MARKIQDEGWSGELFVLTGGIDLTTLPARAQWKLDDNCVLSVRLPDTVELDQAARLGTSVVLACKDILDESVEPETVVVDGFIVVMITLQ